LLISEFSGGAVRKNRATAYPSGGTEGRPDRALGLPNP
jgi:hypothetical protein